MPRTAISKRRLTRADLKSVCRELIHKRCFSTQEEICEELEHRGFHLVNQSKVSRVLKDIGVVKTHNANGKRVYSLVDEQQEPIVSGSTIQDMVREINFNHGFILVHTTPGAANIVARLLDRNRPHFLLGAVAGNDVVLLAPRHTKSIHHAAAQVKQLVQQGA